MTVCIVYKSKDGSNNQWITTEDKLDHIFQVCEAKELEILEVSYVH